jgi:prevent-host-death family protein
MAKEIPMAITTLSSRELNQDVTRAKRAASRGPVIITDRGKPAHVLLSFEEYQRLTHQHRSIADALAMPDVTDIDFQPPRIAVSLRTADLA